MVDRREALRRMGTLAAGAASAAALGCGRGVASGASEAEVTAPRSLDPLGVQLYTVRSEMEKGVEATLTRVAGIGYREVEFAGYFGHSPREIRRMLDSAGLTAPSTHLGLEVIGHQWSATLEAAATMGHRYVVVPSIPPGMRSSLDDWRRLAALFNRAGEESRGMGIQFAYHNHAFEFAEMEGRVQFDVFLEESDPDLVQIELDLFWITDGGGDPVAFISRWPGRIALVHLKDRTSEGEMVDVGAGVIDWAGIFEHRLHAGIRHYFVEHDEPRDAFASIEASYGYLSRLEV
jgi:sugar phosphate isomerase/epimerase